MWLDKKKKKQKEIAKIAQAFAVLGYDAEGKGYFIIDNDEEEVVRKFREKYQIGIEAFRFGEQIFMYAVAHLALQAFLSLEEKELKQAKR